MKPRNFVLLAAIVTGLTLPYLIQASQSDQNPKSDQNPQPDQNLQMDQHPKDALYHQSDMSKPGDTETAAAKAKRAQALVAAHPSYPKSALTKLEILPSSTSILGPRYTQRLVVEGTFADGHQEDLTAQAKIKLE